MGRKNYIILFITLIVTGVTVLFSAMRVSAETSVAQEEKETSGYAGVEKSKSNDAKKTNENITWTYDAATKTLTFGGNGLMMSNEGNIDEDASKYDIGTWYIWKEETEHIVIGEGITNIGDYAFYDFRQLSDVSLPDSLQHIGLCAFAYSGLKSVTIPKGVKKIGQQAFGGSNLSRVTIENGVKEIQNYAFDDTQLEKIVFPKSVYLLGIGVLSECERLKKVVLPPKIKEIPEESFYFCFSLKEITVPKSVVTIGDSAFGNSGLRSITIKNGVKKVGGYAFSYTKLEKITFPKSVCECGEGVLEGCKMLKKVTLPSNIKEIPGHAFEDCIRLQKINIPKSVVKIDSLAFYNTSLKTIEIPENVEVLGHKDVVEEVDGIFSKNKKLRTVKIKSRKLRQVDNALARFPSKAVIIVPKGKKKSYSKMFYKAGLSKKIKIKESQTW